MTRHPGCMSTWGVAKTLPYVDCDAQTAGSSSGDARRADLPPSHTMNVVRIFVATASSYLLIAPARPVLAGLMPRCGSLHEIGHERGPVAVNRSHTVQPSKNKPDVGASRGAGRSRGRSAGI